MTAPRASAFHSRFTPSLLPQATLEALFVQRTELLARLLALIEESANTRAKHQILLVGPRGIGKTHLLALTYHRLKARADLRERICLAWLREEEWGVDSFFEFLRRVLLALDREYPQAALRAAIDALREQPRETLRQAAERILVEFLAGRALLVLCENLDDLFAGMGEQGQEELRSFLQETGTCSLLATAQSLFDGVSRQTAPFYGFFRTERLLGLSFDEAIELVRRLAEFAGDEELAVYLDTSEGRARMRAIQHLSGGNHRVYVVLSQFLTRKSLEELVPALLDLLDALTPYYQSRMQVLEAPQRKLVEAMCARRGAATSEELAKDCFLDEAAATRWLRDLAGKGYACIRGSHEEPMYELQEPLLRLCLEVKAEREEPLRLLVEFLRLWYTRPALEDRLTRLPPTSLEGEYIRVALSRGDAAKEILAACQLDLYRYFTAQDYQAAAQVAEEMLAVDRRSQEALSLVADYVDAMRNLGELLSLQGRHSEAIELFVKATAVAPQRGDVWGSYGMALARAGNLGRALDVFAYARQKGDIEPINRYESIGVQIALHRWPEAVQALRQALTTMKELEIDAFQPVLRYLFQARENASDWPERTRKLVSLFRRQRKLPFLAQAVTRTIGLLLPAAPEDRQRWLHAWKTSAEKEPPMQPALRLLDAAVHYLDSPGPRPLLRLPQEERALLLPLLHLQKDPTNPDE